MTDGTGTVQFDDENGVHADNSTIYLEIRDTCTAAVAGRSVCYTVDGRL